MFYIDVKHDGLKKFRRISGADKYVVEQRARAQTEAWDELWQRRLKVEKHRQEQQQRTFAFETKKAKAARLTADAQEVIASLDSILSTGLKSAHFNIEMLYDRTTFSEPMPICPVEKKVPQEPTRGDATFDVVKDLWSLLIPSIKRKREATAQAQYEKAHIAWNAAKDEIIRQNAAAKLMYENSLAQRLARGQAFEEQKQDHNSKIDAFRLR